MDVSTLDKKKGDHISGIDRGKVVMYGLSTCVWCKKTKKLLTDLGVDFDFIYVDKLDGEEEDQAVGNKALQSFSFFPDNYHKWGKGYCGL
jgi:glutaredoxin